jgi:hypothetical protein
VGCGLTELLKGKTAGNLSELKADAGDCCKLHGAGPECEENGRGKKNIKVRRRRFDLGYWDPEIFKM